jgi:MFS family permease
VLAAVVASVSTIFSVFALAFAVDPGGLDRSVMLWVAIVANAVALAAIPLLASLADRIGRRPVFIAGTLGSAVLAGAYLWSITTGSYALIFVIGVLLSGVVYSAPNGVWPAFYAEMFPTKVRLSGMALGTQIGFAIGGFAPTVAAWLAGGELSGWLPVAIFTAALCLVSAGAAFTARETYRTPMAELGTKRPVGSGAGVPAA